ncbi:GspH/FimT family pseudopilin [Oxalobacteraceae sp. CFBP 13730]|nr:GspH/FimT family pseudopilin [Oxalobacteraceae sp. CFBP 13730]
MIAPAVNPIPRSTRCARCRGVSLAELAVVLGMVAITAALAAPGLHRIVQGQELRVAASDLYSAIQLARSQAIARNEPVIVTSNDAAGIDWSRGWTVYVDHDNNRQAGAGDDILAVRATLAQGVQVGYSFASAAAPQYIAYNGAGRSCSATSSAAARPGTLSLFHGGQVRRIKINMLGRPRLCNPARDAGCDGATAPP